MSAPDLSDPGFIEFLAKNATPADRAKFGPYVKKVADRNERLRLQPKQQLAEKLAQEVDALLYGGAAGGGKTHWLLVHVARQMLDYPGNRGVIFRRVFPSLNRTIIPRARSLYKPWAEYNKVEHVFYFHNGSILELASLQYADSVDDYQGAEYGVVAFEEVTEFLESQVDYFKSRLRAPVDGPRPHLIATTNPGGVGHRWVKREWVKPKPEDVAQHSPAPEPYRVWKAQPKGAEPPMTRAFVPATLDDNPALLERDPSYRDRLRALKNVALRKAYEKGDWDAIEEVEGAQWALDQIEASRILRADLVDLAKIVVGVDPSGTHGNGNEQGIVGVGKGYNAHGYVLEDRSCSLNPSGWGQRAVQLALDLEAEEIVVEKNFGGDMATDVIKNAMRALGVKPTAIKVEPVSASRGKKVRAEPIAQLYGDPDDPSTWEASEMHHAGTFEELEEQQTTWLPESGESPDRMDGMVWAATRLLIVDEDESGFFWGS